MKTSCFFHFAPLSIFSKKTVPFEEFQLIRAVSGTIVTCRKYSDGTMERKHITSIDGDNHSHEWIPLHNEQIGIKKEFLTEEEYLLMYSM